MPDHPAHGGSAGGTGSSSPSPQGKGNRFQLSVPLRFSQCSMSTAHGLVNGSPTPAISTHFCVQGAETLDQSKSKDHCREESGAHTNDPGRADNLC